MHRTEAISAPNKDDSHYSLELSLTQFSTNLNNLSAQQYSLPYVVSNADLVGMQTLIFAATIHLHRDALEIQPESYQKCFWAANAMTTLIRSLSENDYDLLCPIISVSVLTFSRWHDHRGRRCASNRWTDVSSCAQTCWRAAAEVYLRMLAMPPGQSMPTNPELIEQQVDFVVAAMRRLSCLFPIAGMSTPAAARRAS